MKAFFSVVLPLSFFVITTYSCTSSKKITEQAASAKSTPTNTGFVRTEEDAFFEDIFHKNHKDFDSLLAKRKELNIQVIYTRVDRGKNGIPRLKTHYFNRANAGYFYPASTVKLPVAILALQRLNELKSSNVNKFSTLITKAAYSGQTAVYNDPNSSDGRPTIAQYIKKIFLVSDNDAYNRLYEFLGQEYINEELHKRGYREAQLLHRLNIFLTPYENRHCNPVSFYDSSGKLLYSQPMQFNRKQYEKRNDFLGKAWYGNNKLQNGPMDFSAKNRISLPSLHNILLSIVMPESVPSTQRFNITEEDRLFLLKYMSAYPSESVFPSYDSSYYDAFVKFLFYGSEKRNLPKNIRLFNKVGNAYGQLVDVAYFADFDKKIEFFLSAAIYCNTDGVLNDDKYDYYNLGLPFMKNLGRAFYEYELRRKKEVEPDLSPYKFEYGQ